MNSWDRRLIERYLKLYLSLDQGTRNPDTPAQGHFVSVCRGEASPRTQHEIAYTKYLRVRLAKKPQKKTRDEKLPDITPTDKVIDIVTAIEEEELGNSRWKETVSVALGKVRDGYRSGVTIAKGATFETALWTTAILSDREFARGIDGLAPVSPDTLTGLQLGSDEVSR